MKFSGHLCVLAVLSLVVLPAGAKADERYRSIEPARHAVGHAVRHHRVRHARAHSHRVAPTRTAPPAGAPWVAEAQRYLGGNPTGWSHLWCARFMNLVLGRVGVAGTGSNFARSFAQWGRPAGPRPGAIVVIARGGGGHVGIVLADDGASVTVLSGNHGHRVGIGRYRKSQVVAYRWPPGGHAS